MRNELTKGLASLRLLINNNPIEGLYFTNDINQYTRSPYVFLGLKKANKYNVDAVFFRHFHDDRPPIPQIYIFDYTRKALIEQEFAQLHKRIWNSLQVPLIYVFTSTEVLIFNSYSPKIRDEFKYNIYQNITIADTIDKTIRERNEKLINDFNANNFSLGFFWERQEYSKDFDFNNGVYKKLLSKLNEIRIDLLNTKSMYKDASLTYKEKKSTIHKLLIMSLLIKYLEEKRDEDNNTVFRKEFFNKYSPSAESFIDVLHNNGNIIQLFEDLSVRFNGEVFLLNDNEKRLILKLNLIKFAEFFEGKTEKYGQISLWRLYSFQDLPVELISNIYEDFLRDENSDESNLEKHKSKSEQKQIGAYYTPPFLVNFLLEQVLPLNLSTKNHDFKILDPSCGSGIFLVQAYKRLIHIWELNNEWKKPTLKILKELLEKNIFGVDIKEEAVRLTTFSLTLALCEELNPIEIWENLKFDKLRENILPMDFFRAINENMLPRDFDIVLGNPPFINNLTEDAEFILNKRKLANLPDIKGNYSLTTLFLEQSSTLIKSTGNVFLLFPASAFFFRDKKFLEYFYNKFNISCIVDFVPLRRILFKNAAISVIALLFNKNKKENTNVLHVVVRRTKSSRNELYFELDKYDFHEVSIINAIQTSFIWKTHIFGVSNRHFELVRKLKTFKKLKEYDNILFTKKKKKDIPYLLIKKNIIGYDLKSQIIVNGAKIDNDLTSETVKLFSLQDDISQLKVIKSKIDEEISLHKFWIMNTSNRVALGRSAATTSGDDIYNIPFDFNKPIYKNLTEIERIIVDDCVNYWFEFIRLGENSKMVLEKADDILEDYSKIYLNVLNSVYNDFKALKPINSDTSIVFTFYFGDEIPKLPSSTEELNEKLFSILSYKIPHANVIYQRVIRIYNGTTIYIIKPNQKRYWLRSIAIRDADETFEYITKQGLIDEP